MTEREIEQARKSKDKKVIDDAYMTCLRCGNNQFVITYFPAISERHHTCTNCLRVS